MSDVQVFKIDVPVSANQRLIRARNSKALINSKRYRNWFYLAVLQLKTQRRLETLKGRIAVSITVHFADKRKRDLDNLLKGFFDACTHAKVFEDDSQIDSLSIERAQAEKPASLIAKIWEINTKW